MTKDSRRWLTARTDAQRFADRCARALEGVYQTVAPEAAGGAERIFQASVEYVVRMAAALVCAKQAPDGRECAEPAKRAAAAIECGGADGAVDFESAISSLRVRSRLGIFCECPELAGNRAAFAAAAAALRLADGERPVEPVYCETMPLSWLSAAYQRMLAYRPSAEGPGLQRDMSVRRQQGMYFTPPSLISYIVENALEPLVESRRLGTETPEPAILDPAMGGGDFLARAAEFVLQSLEPGADSERAARLAFCCIYGVDIDPTAVEIARFRVWAVSRYADGIGDELSSRLRRADVLSGVPGVRWRTEFPRVFERGGFDAVVGNPPYLASKNGLRRGPATARGQSDTYLMFLGAVLDAGLVKPGGTVSMVLPDPMLVRENAAPIRRKILSEWTLVSLLHISGAFPEARVANIVPVLRNVPGESDCFIVSRIESAADRRSFALRPRQTAAEAGRGVRVAALAAQDRCEFVYLLEQGEFASTLRLIHGDRLSLSEYQPPFARLADLNVSAMYRGEEIGKAAIDSDSGELPILLGGQSIQPYHITWEGRRIDSRRVRKPLDRYLSTKLLIQKSSSRLIAALDRVSRKHTGYVFPQSVYAVELSRPGISEFYLLCLLNSRVMNEYLWRTATAYKLLQPQIELEDLRGLPIRRISFVTPSAERQAETATGIAIYHTESLRSDDGGPFEELAEFARRCLTHNPERSDVVHDLLVYLGRLLVDSAAADRLQPDPVTTRRIETARAAVETVVEQLYSCSPLQMSMPL